MFFVIYKPRNITHRIGPTICVRNALQVFWIYWIANFKYCFSAEKLFHLLIIIHINTSNILYNLLVKSFIIFYQNILRINIDFLLDTIAESLN